MTGVQTCALPIFDDAGDYLHAVGREPLAQRLHDGNATDHHCLEGHHHAGLAGASEDLVAMHGQQCLVGGDDLLALGNGGQHDITGQRGAAHYLHQNVDGGVIHDVERIAAERNVGAHQLADFLRVMHDDATDLDGAAGAPADLGSVILQHLEFMVFPFPSVRRPSSNACRNTSNILGCDFSISSNNTIE